MRPDSIETAFAKIMQRVEELESGSKIYAQAAPATYSADPVYQDVEFASENDGFGE